jgi:hypothetical protein
MRIKILIFGLLAIITTLVYFNVRAYQTVKKQHQFINSLIGIDLQFANSLQNCKNPTNMPQLEATHLKIKN